MSRFIIEGKHPLNGDVTISGNKNAALPIIAATLLTDEPVTIHNVPRIGDIYTLLSIIGDLGVEYTWIGPNSLWVQAKEIRKTTLDPQLCEVIRASILLAGPMLARIGKVDIFPPGGDVIGRRRLDTHFLAFEALGATVTYHRYFRLHREKLHGSDILLDEASVTATENAIMAAVIAEGTTTIRNAASEPHVQDLCRFLNSLGAKIRGIGSNQIVIEGVAALHGGQVTIGSDLLEVGSFIGLGAVTAGEIRIHGARKSEVEMANFVFQNRLGIRLRWDDDILVIPDDQDLHVISDIGDAVPKIDDAPWPMFPADLMSIALVMATQADGIILIHEKMFESRLYFVDKLISMGARIILCDPHRAVVSGPTKLHGQHLTSPDIRAGMALLIAAITADGESRIDNIEQIDRGYQAIDEKLRRLGAVIRRE